MKGYKKRRVPFKGAPVFYIANGKPQAIEHMNNYNIRRPKKMLTEKQKEIIEGQTFIYSVPIECTLSAHNRWNLYNYLKTQNKLSFFWIVECAFNWGFFRGRNYQARKDLRKYKKD